MLQHTANYRLHIRVLVTCSRKYLGNYWYWVEKRNREPEQTCPAGLQHFLTCTCGISLAMGRKRNQGKARKAAKARAKAREEAEDSNNQRTNGQQRLLAEQMQQLQLGNSNFLSTSGSDATKCYHGFKEMDNTCIDFVIAFRNAVHEADKRGESTSQSLVEAKNATMDKFADVWNDSAQMKSAISMLLCRGTQHVLDGNYVIARDLATFARYMEQHVAVKLHQTQALMHWPKIYETYIAGIPFDKNKHPSDLHTLVKFFRKRVCCSCLDAKYEEVKAAAKMGLCFNLKCNLPRVERFKTMYCSRCRFVPYCSRECQTTHWKRHQPDCDAKAALIAEFAKQQNTWALRVISPSSGKLGQTSENDEFIVDRVLNTLQCE